MTLTVEHVADDVTRIYMTTWRGHVTGYDVSAWIVRGVLIDTGFHRVAAEFLPAIKALAPRGAIVTHWHEDHSGNAPALAALGLPLLMHPECEATLRTRPAITGYRKIVWKQAPRLGAPLVGFDSAPLEIIATPGHSPDHLAIWDPERRMLASGDLFLGVKVRVAHVHESPSQVLASLRTAIALRPLVLLDAHRGMLTDAEDRLRAKVAWMEEMVGKILRLADTGVRPEEIRRRVLGSEPVVGLVSFGEYSKRAFVDGVLRERALLLR